MPDGGPSTDEHREVLAEQIWNAIAEEEDVIIKSPTAAGKSHLISSLFGDELDEKEFLTDGIGGDRTLYEARPTSRASRRLSGIAGGARRPFVKHAVVRLEFVHVAEQLTLVETETAPVCFGVGTRRVA